MFRLITGAFFALIIAMMLANAGVTLGGAGVSTPLNSVGSDVGHKVASLREQLAAERARRQQETGCCSIDPLAGWLPQQ